MIQILKEELKMKKSLLITLMICFVLFAITGCSSDAEVQTSGLSSISNETSSETGMETQSAEVVPETVPIDDEGQEMNATEFEALLTQLPISVVSTIYVVQDDEYKSLYPDLLQTVIINNTDYDIKDAILAIVAWDENNLPVKIKGNIDFSEGSYIKEVNYSDINLIGGSTFGEGYGFGIEETMKISSFRAIPVSFITFDGSSWTNPYYDAWKMLYEGNKFMETMSVKVVVDETQNVMLEAQNNSQNSSKTQISEPELLSQIEGQALKVIETKYTIQDNEYKSLYPDLLQAVIKNDTEHDIKNAIVAFVAWDENKLPVKIKGNIDFSDGTYVKLVNYNDINLIPGKTFGQNSGFELDEHHKVKTFKAIVVSFESFNGTTWENPLFNEWKMLYEGQKIN
jgi:hypothetical protein